MREGKGSFERTIHAWEASWNTPWLVFCWFQSSSQWRTAVVARSPDNPSGYM